MSGKKKIEDFELEIGDRFYSKEGAYSQILGVVQDDVEPGGGYFQAKRVAPDGGKYLEEISFEIFLDEQDDIQTIEKVPELPKDIATKRDLLSPRLQAALNQLQKIEQRLEDPNLIAKERRDLLRGRATAHWEISSELPPSPTETDSVSKP